MDLKTVFRLVVLRFTVSFLIRHQLINLRVLLNWCFTAGEKERDFSYRKIKVDDISPSIKVRLLFDIDAYV